MPPELIADVAVRATLKPGASAVFSYLVPPRLHGLALPGQLVWVPLRRQRVQGVVLASYEATPDSAQGVPSAALREIADLADPEAVITAAGLRLARWVAETYHTPLYEALALLLPPGVTQEADVTWRATPAGMAVDLGALPERERGILYYLRLRGETTERELRADLRGGDSELREAYALLHERGLAARGAAFSAPRARPRRERLARLTVAADQLDQTLAALARAPRQQAVLQWLAQQDFGAPPAPDGNENDTEPANSQRPAANGQQPTAHPLAGIYEATGANATLLRQLEAKGLIAFETRELRRDPLSGDGIPPDNPPMLTAAQRRVWEPIAAALDADIELRASHVERTARQPGTHNAALKTFLLHGVTGSGKTEIYLRAIARALRRGRQALVLVPEIALTAQLVRRFAARFPGQLAVLHSGLSLGERYDEWRRLRRGAARLAIGSRSAVFAPLPELGLIIVDEEHEPTYKHDSSPRYHARDAALHLAALTDSVVLLGSATPGVESYYAARSGRATLLEMSERVGSVTGLDGLTRSQPLPLPPVRLVDMRRELQSGNRSIFSRPLQQALDAALERGEQALLFLNRRGVASFVMCRDCGHVVACPACSSPLTLHYDEADDRRPALDDPSIASSIVYGPSSSILVCHSCNYRQLVPAACTECLSPRIKAFGIGTQRVEEEVQRLFPQTRTLRWDRDSVTGKGAHGRLLDQFLRHEADVLIGTQMIAKGLDLPLVSLVGVVAADTGLHLPDFRSGERAFQLLTQVAGRAGRRSAGARVVIQTYTPEHYALQAAQEHDYHAFYTQEIAFRRQTGYPPFGRLVRFIYAGGSENACRREAQALAERLRNAVERLRLEDWHIIGPAPAFLQRLRGRWRWHLLVRLPSTPDERVTLPAFLAALGPLYGWIVDVDPVHVL